MEFEVRRSTRASIARRLQKEFASTPLKKPQACLDTTALDEFSAIMQTPSEDGQHSLLTLDRKAAEINAESNPTINNCPQINKASEKKQSKVAIPVVKQLEEMRPTIERSAKKIDRINEKLRTCEGLMCHGLMAGLSAQDQGVTFAKELKRHKQLTAAFRKRFGEEFPQPQGPGVNTKTSYQLLQSLFD
ncbi:uncharacterized protein LOC144723288 [Lampetra planeri]